MRARDEFLLVAPRDRAEVGELGDALFEEDAVHVQIIDAARALRGSASVLVVASELHARFQVLADGLHGDVLDEPLRLHTIDAGHTVVELLEEVNGRWQVLVGVVDAALQDDSIAAYILVLEWCSALVDLFHGDADVDEVGWKQALLGHQDCLLAGLWEVLEDPTTAGTVCHLDTLLNQLHQHQVIKVTTLLA